MVPKLRASAEYFRWSTTVALFSVLLVSALLTLTDACSVFWEFGASSHGSFGRLAGLDTSHTCLGFLGSGFLMHGPFVCYCPVAWEFILCRPLLLLVPGVLLWILTFFLVVLGAVYFCLFQSPIMSTFVFARWLHPLAAVLGTYLEDIFYFTPNKESTAGMNAGSENNLLLRGFFVVAWLLLLVFAWECWSCWDFSIARCGVFVFVHRPSPGRLAMASRVSLTAVTLSLLCNIFLNFMMLLRICVACTYGVSNAALAVLKQSLTTDFKMQRKRNGSFLFSLCFMLLQYLQHWRMGGCQRSTYMCEALPNLCIICRV